MAEIVCRDTLTFLRKIQRFPGITQRTGQAGFNYDETKAKLTGFMLPDGHYQGTYYFPADGQRETFTIELEAGQGEPLVPRFKDDVAIIIRQD